MSNGRVFSDYSEDEQKEMLIHFIRNEDIEICAKLVVEVEKLYPQYLELVNKLLLLK